MDVEVMIKAGANNLPALTSSLDELGKLRLTYQDASWVVFVFLLVSAGLAFLATFGFENKNVRKIGREQKESGA
jgi:phosphotransferase system  glucose/maltose/N-acetylglucosamine-specific IIC component